MPSRPTPPTFQIDNLTNRLDGTADLISKASTSLAEVDAQIRERAALRKRLVGAIRGDPDRKDHADRDGRVFKLEMAGLSACAAGLRRSLCEWEGEVELLRCLLARARARGRC